MGLCEDYPSCDKTYHAAMPLSRAPTRGRYSRIVGVTHDSDERPGMWRRSTALLLRMARVVGGVVRMQLPLSWRSAGGGGASVKAIDFLLTDQPAGGASGLS